jgi:pimeloyl-ACP methyl ester carboxylesterase
MKMGEQQIPGLILVDHEFEVPLDYSKPDGERITVFAREVVAADKKGEKLPWLLFLQGGPGFGAPRPEGKGGWLKRALAEYRVVLLDQRGTGRSSPIESETLGQLGSPEAQADYLKQFRADGIVQDAELIRRALLGDEPWSVLGQSYGGFCAVHYLSAAPEGLREVIITGGIPPLARPADDIYRATYQRVVDKNEQFYGRYPADEERAKEIVAYLQAHEVYLPGGDRLTPRRFQQLGIQFGDSSGFESVHYLLEEAFVSGRSGRVLSYAFRRHLENTLSFDTNPIYSLLHEACYTQGEASKWSAERVRGEYGQFEATAGERVYFTGEMIYPWMFEEYGVLAPLREAAEILAQYSGWPRLYDGERLRANRVPVVAAVYYEDMYVERLFSEESAREIGNCRLWVTNEHEHSALRRYGEAVLGRLLDMLHGEV